MRRLPRTALLVALLGFLGLTACGRGGAPAPGALAGWNVLLITIDTLRADHLGYAGYDVADTPTFDGLASSGVVFENAISGAPVTLPAHSTILTGLFPPRHGALDNGFYSLPDDVPTLATILHDAGYSTGAVIGAYVLHGQYGLSRGFDSYDDRFRQPRTDEQEHRERAAEIVTDRALEWIDQRDPDRPFLLWTHYYDPHAPYNPRGSYALRFATRPYDGEIAYTDEHVGRLLEGLASRGLRKRTLVVFTADHGEALGDRGELTHGLLLARSTLHVPLVINAPGTLPARRVGGVVSDADILPTILELTGVPVPDGLDGVSLLPAVAKGSSHDQIAYSETRLPQDMYGWSMLAGVTEDGWAYVHAPIPELYDLRKDPKEANNLCSEMPDKAAELDAKVVAVLAAGRDAKPNEITPDDVEALRALGYVAGSEIPEPTGADPKERIAAWNRVNELRQYVTTGRYQEMADGLEEVLREDPGNREARVLLGQALVGLGRTEEGIHEFRLLADQGWFLGRSGTLFARTLAEGGHQKEAEELLRSFEKLEPKFAEHPFNLGVLLSSEGRKDEAREEFERAYRLNPDGVHILSNLAMALVDGKDTDPADATRALDLIDRAIGYAESSDRPRLMKAEILKELGRVDEARAVADSLARDPSYQDITSAEVSDLLRSLKESPTGSR